MTAGWPDLRRERTLGGMVCGVDEAGVAPLAGPVVAAAVVLPDTSRKPRRLRGLTDSKLLGREERERLYAVIREHCRVGVGVASVEEIDALNIYHANLRAMQRAVADLGVRPDAAIVDGRAAPDLACPVETVIKGDQRCLSIAAASVVAKVTRDGMMADLARRHPGYGWETNVGYGTDEHYLGLLRLGPTEHHRRSFAPIRTLFGAEQRNQLGLRFEPSDGPCRIANLRLLELRQDLVAIFDEEGRHVGILRRLRGGWRFHAVGYDADGRPLSGEGPLAPYHRQPLDEPEREALIDLLTTRPRL